MHYWSVERMEIINFLGSALPVIFLMYGFTVSDDHHTPGHGQPGFNIFRCLFEKLWINAIICRLGRIPLLLFYMDPLVPKIHRDKVDTARHNDQQAKKDQRIPEFKRQFFHAASFELLPAAACCSFPALEPYR